MKGLKNASDNDIIILSDVDEIPNLNKLNEFDKKNMQSSHKKCSCTN